MIKPEINRIQIIDEALKKHYRQTMERKRVPSDYILMFTEGGEADAIASDIEKATYKETVKMIKAKLEDMLKEDFISTPEGVTIDPRSLDEFLNSLAEEAND